MYQSMYVYFLIIAAYSQDYEYCTISPSQDYHQVLTSIKVKQCFVNVIGDFMNSEHASFVFFKWIMHILCGITLQI